MKNYTDLRVWQKAIDLAELLYSETRSFPQDERYGLTQQIRRSVVSIASNIAEGCGRNKSTEFSHFLGIANGSLAELKTQIIIAHRIGYWRNEQFQTLSGQTDEIGKMLSGLRRSIRESIQATC